MPTPNPRFDARILVTGSRNWVDEKAVAKALLNAWLDYRDHGTPILVHGGCPTGADAIADKVWRKQGFPVEVHPADWDAHGKAAGPLRNQAMVDLGADLVLAFPLGVSRGTRDCMARARSAGLLVQEVAT